MFCLLNKSEKSEFIGTSSDIYPRTYLFLYCVIHAVVASENQDTRMRLCIQQHKKRRHSPAFPFLLFVLFLLRSTFQLIQHIAQLCPVLQLQMALRIKGHVADIRVGVFFDIT